MILWRLAAAGATILFATSAAIGADWPAYRHDAGRTGATEEKLELPLNLLWKYKAAHPPRPAWPPPAERDWHPKRQGIGTYVDLLTFDHVFHPVVAGDRIYFGSSSEHTLTCLDTRTGEVKWVFFTEGPVRLAPALAEGRVYLGSDDGRLYCLDAKTGKRLWQYRVGPGNRRLPGNEQMISRWPLRSGVVVRSGVVYTAAGVFPRRLGVWLAAVDAKSGKEKWKQQLNQVAQGHLVASNASIVVAGGEGTAQSHALATGDQLGVVGTRGTTGVVIDDMLAWGPHVYGNSMAFVRADSVGTKFIQLNALHLVASPSRIFGVTKNKHLFALDRGAFDVQRWTARKQTLETRRKIFQSVLDDPAKTKKAKDAASKQLDAVRDNLAEADKALANVAGTGDDTFAWRKECEQNNQLIRAGDSLIAAGNREVMAYRAADGKALWRGRVDGNAHDLAVADGRLYVSTDSGAIHCFASGNGNGTVLKSDTADSYAETDRAEVYMAAAKTITETVEADKGYCLDLGCGDGGLAYAIAKQTKFTVVAVEPDPERAAAAREALRRAGLYGVRIVVHEAPLDKLPYPSCVFNLIVSGRTFVSGALPPNAKEAKRVLRPCGGTLWLGQSAEGELTEQKLAAWLKTGGMDGGQTAATNDGVYAVYRRDRLPGAGAWTHQYADGANTGCSSDTAIKRPVEMQWYGRPGPRSMFDRHAFSHAPLYRYGRLFTLAGEKKNIHIIASDAYNGTLLWKTRLGQLRPRVNIPRDSGYMALDRDHLYVAASTKCYILQVKNGNRLRSAKLPKHGEETLYQWGYVAADAGILYGSGVRVGRFYRHGHSAWHDKVTAKVCSDFLCALDAATHDLKWKYDGVVINSSITLGDGRLYFVENRQEAVVSDKDRIVSESGKLVIVALDAEKGEKIWDTPVTYEDAADALFGQYKAPYLIITRCRKAGRHNAFQDIAVYEAATGKEVWRKDIHAGVGHHGSHRRKTLIIGNTILQDPNAFDLKTGEKKWTMMLRPKCGTLSASAYYLFGRYGSHHLFSIADLAGGRLKEAVEPLTLVTRPGCWINTITGGGLVLTPEASSGCVCYYPVHATMAFVSTQESPEMTASVGDTGNGEDPDEEE